MQSLAAILKVRPGEGRSALLLVGMMFIVAVGGSIGGNGIDALFFARFGTQYLPYMYMALGVITLITSLSVTALLGRVARQRLYVALPLILAGILIVERLIITLNFNGFYPVFWLGMNVTGSLQGLFTWGLAGLVWDSRQAKRLFPLFSAGGILGSVVGGLSTQSLASLLHSENLLLVWAGALLIVFLINRSVVGPAPAAIVHRRQAPITEEILQGYQFVRQSSLMRWMSLANALFAVLFFSLSQPFSQAAVQQFPNADALAGFLGLFQGLSTAVAFLASLFLANRLFARFGIMSMVMVFALIYLAGFGLLAVYDAFPALVVFRFIQGAFLSGIAGTAWQTVFNVVPPERRDQVRTFIDGVPGQAGTVIAGLVLVIGAQTLQPQQLYLIGLGAAVLTTIFIWQGARSYGGALLAALRAGQPQLFFTEEEPFGGFQHDWAAVAASIAAVSDPDSMTRRVSAEILGHLPMPEAAQALVGALNDSDAEVRVAALRALTHASATSALPAIVTRLTDPEPEVRLQAIAAVQTLAVNGDVLQPLLNDPEPPVRARAAAAILRAGPNAEASNLLRQMVVFGELEDRRAAMMALAEWGDAEAFELVAVELEDIGVPSSIRQAAVSALLHMNHEGQRAVEPLVHRLGDNDPGVQTAAAKALGEIGPAALDGVTAALSIPTHQEGALQALEAFASLPVTQPIRDYARGRAEQALHYLNLYRIAASSDSTSERGQLLTDSLQARALREGINALRATALLGERDSISLAIDNLKSSNPAQRANALETLDSSHERQLVRPLLALWETGEAASVAPVNNYWLLTLLQDGDDWLRACAAYSAGDSGDDAVRTWLAELAQADPDALVRETAAASLKGNPSMETLSTLSLMERILCLRRVPLFTELSPADLKQVAAIATERVYPDGELIARQNDPGDELYIIVSGEVRVVVASGATPGTEVARRKPGEYVGEMSLLSHKPRMASLAAVGSVRLLCIDQPQFEALLRQRPETSLAVIRVLCARLEEMPVV